MQNIIELLQRYRNITPPDAAIKNRVLKVVSEVLGIGLHKSDISVIRGSVYIQADPTIKSTLFIHKEALLKKIQEEVGETVVTEIR